MSSPVQTVREDARLGEVQAKLAQHGVSAVPVLDATTRLAGVITRTDLLRVGRVRPAEGEPEHAVNLPTGRVREYMTPTVEVIGPDTPLNEAARRMVDREHHRLFVATNGRLMGVVSTREMMRAVSLVGVSTPLSEIMSTAIVTVQIDDPLVLAVDRMAESHHRGLVVTDQGWPVGIFGQIEALAARDASPQRSVGEWMSRSFLSLPAGMPAHHAAAQSMTTRAHRIVAVRSDEASGIVSGLDFTRLVAQADG
jgi:CBS domain-containing protein